MSLGTRVQREGFRARVTRILQAWADWAVYPTDFLMHINDVFLGLDKETSGEGGDSAEGGAEAAGGQAGGGAGSDASSPGSSSSAEWGGGGAGPLDGAALRRLAATHQPPHAHAHPHPHAAHTPPHDADADIDGVPVDEDIDGVPLEGGGGAGAGSPGGAGAFVPSRWESVDTPAGDPAPPPPPPPAPPRDPTPPPADSGTLSGEEHLLSRDTLREIEVRVLKYADELEAGARARRNTLAPQQQIQHYRRKLIKKAVKEARAARAAEETRTSPEPRRRSPVDEDTYSTSSKKSKKSREPSLSPPPKRSRHTYACLFIYLLYTSYINVQSWIIFLYANFILRIRNT
ncbi:unnamed protein product [Diatraea saccharalis]|uniref:CID domain-containing protein n=1 Tax=Diatraea saccharalis TaxID=40085 RepID=A0A9P0CD18_9NEOP|nr:unnamed protein product [Diatraea saccharalis]